MFYKPDITIINYNNLVIFPLSIDWLKNSNRIEIVKYHFSYSLYFER